jgi:hypothetical protein
MVAAGWRLVGCRHLVVVLGCHSADVLVVALLGRCAAGAAWLVCGVGVRWKPDRREGDVVEDAVLCVAAKVVVRLA